MTENATYRNALALNSMLLEYRLEAVLGAGGFGMTYLGWDSHLEKHVAIKEYLPGELAIRALDGSVVPVNTDSEYNYKWGLERFIQEARTLAKFSHPNIVRVNRFFEANGTSYMVMDYEAGESLYQRLQRAPLPDEATLKRLLLPILDGLEAIHAAGFLHRDIKPSNVFMRENGVPVLIDFGASRLAAANSSRQLTAIVSPGYAPLEQYAGDGNQGPWTDIYGLAGVMYRAVTDENPPDAVRRMRSDAVPAGLAAARGRYSERFLKAVGWGLNLDEKLRPQNVGQWRELVNGRVPSSALDRVPGAVEAPPRTTAATTLRVTAPAAQKIAARAVDAHSSVRAATVAPGPWKWLWRGALFCMAAIAAAAMVKPQATERDPHKQSAPQLVRSVAAPGQAVVASVAAVDTAHRKEPPPVDANDDAARTAGKFEPVDASRNRRVDAEDGAAAARADAAARMPPVGGDTRAVPDPDARRAANADGASFALKKEFMVADRDGDGYLSAWEVKGRFPAIERNLGEVDTDRDGRISLDEFAQFRRKLMAVKLPRP